MNLGDLIGSLQKVGVGLSAALTFAFLTIWLLSAPPEPTLNGLEPVRGTIGAAAIVFGAVAVWRLIATAYQAMVTVLRSVPRNPSCRFDQLNEMQRRLLVDTFSQGSRHFQLPVETGRMRWVEELMRHGWIEVQPVFFAGSYVDFEIPETSWSMIQEELIKFNKWVKDR